MGVAVSGNGPQAPKEKSGQIDINSATKEQLLTLPGIDDGLAAKIIAGRPYKKAAELKTKRLLATAAYNRISGKIIAAPSTALGTGEWTGRVSTGIAAVGGETTGIILTTATDRFELQPADPVMRKRLEDLDGRLVTIRGKLETRPGVEVRARRIIQVTAIGSR
jgi:hypothetical protein